MIKSEWYTNRTWNGNIDSKFEKYFKHTRDAANKAAYLQIQGALLLDNNQQNVQNVGVALLTRAIEDFPAEHTSVILAQEKLGDFYLAQHNYALAETFFRTVTEYCKSQNSIGTTSGIAELKLAETILHLDQPAKLEEAYQLVMCYPVATLKLMDVKFYYTSLAAQVCDATNKPAEAKEFATAALKLPKLVKPGVNKTKTAAQKTTGRQLRTLLEIAGE